jgi:hypothetical protein
MAPKRSPGGDPMAGAASAAVPTATSPVLGAASTPTSTASSTPTKASSEPEPATRIAMATGWLDGNEVDLGTNPLDPAQPTAVAVDVAEANDRSWSCLQGD